MFEVAVTALSDAASPASAVERNELRAGNECGLPGNSLKRTIAAF